jgi:hypothetical protein
MKLYWPSPVVSPIIALVELPAWQPSVISPTSYQHQPLMQPGPSLELCSWAITVTTRLHLY